MTRSDERGLSRQARVADAPRTAPVVAEAEQLQWKMESPHRLEFFVLDLRKKRCRRWETLSGQNFNEALLDVATNWMISRAALNAGTNLQIPNSPGVEAIMTMFRSALSRLPAIFLALAACLMTASGPMRIMVQIEESKSETSDQIEAKEFCTQKVESRRLRPKHHQHPFYFQLPPETARQLPVISLNDRLPFNYWQTAPPLLRAPPLV